jgi:hypothetical protein
MIAVALSVPSSANDFRILLAPMGVAFEAVATSGCM